MYPYGLSVLETKLFLRNMNELSDNFSFDFEIKLVFEAEFVFCFLLAIFQIILALNGGSKSINFAQK